jgi:Flp pilus assembly protein TadG
MRWRWRLSLAQWRRREEGSVSVEFAILVPLFLVLVFGIIDFGHAWYIREVVANASREGARYGVRFQTDNAGVRIMPVNLTPTIQNYVMSILPASVPTPEIQVTGQATTETNLFNLPGKDLTVTINTTKTWFVIGNLIPSLGSSQPITVSSTMKCE